MANYGESFRDGSRSVANCNELAEDLLYDHRVLPSDSSYLFFFIFTEDELGAFVGAMRAASQPMSTDIQPAS
jgi:hypothetical protein